MPELPEVTTITNQLKKELVEKVFSNVFVNLNYKTYPSNEGFIKDVAGSKVLDVYRIAKVIIIKIAKDEKESYITIHLAMTGGLRYFSSEKKHLGGDSVLVKFEFEDDSILTFTDQRRFGYVKLLDEREFLTLTQKYASDPFEINLKSFEKNIKSKRTNIKNALLNQSLISGIGNIYANDALFMAKIHPETKTVILTIAQLNSLLTALKTILKEGINHKGSTLSDLMYTDIYGGYGEHQKYFRVYGKNGSPCAICTTNIEFKILNGRGTYYCLKCQPFLKPVLTL